MSNEAIGWAYRQPIESAGKKFVLVALADFADESWTCYPGQARIAAMTGQNVRSVRRHLEELEAEGYIERKRRFLGNGQRTSDRYVINRDAAELPLDVVDGSVENTPQPPDNMTGGQFDLRSISTVPADNLSGYPLENPQVIPPTPTADAAGEPCRKHAKTGKPGLNCRHCGTTARALAEAAEAEARRLPERCGQCDQHRMVELADGRLARCPRCHPLAVAS